MSETTMKKPKLELKNGVEIRDFRRKLGLNQEKFWTRIGVTQSGGSRYESGREMPEPALILLNIAYAKEKTALALLNYLRATEDKK